MKNWVWISPSLGIALGSQMGHLGMLLGCLWEAFLSDYSLCVFEAIYLTYASHLKPYEVYIFFEKEIILKPVGLKIL